MQQRSGQVIRHIVFFSARQPGDVDRILDGLSVLTAIPSARRLEIARNAKADQLGNDIDVVVYGEFDDEAALAAYKAHPLYQQSIALVRPLRELRFAADFDTATAVTAPVPTEAAARIQGVGTPLSAPPNTGP